VLVAIIYACGVLLSEHSFARLWLVSAVPAVAIIAGNFFLFNPIFDFTMMQVRLPIDSKFVLIDVIIGMAIPLSVEFFAVILLPVVDTFLQALLFALPAFLAHLSRYSISDWFFPGISSIMYPGDTPGAGYQELINGLESIPVSLLMFLLVASTCWLASMLRYGLRRS